MIISDLSFARYVRLQHVILNKSNFLSNYYEVNIARMAAHRLFSHASLAGRKTQSKSYSYRLKKKCIIQKKNIKWSNESYDKRDSVEKIQSIFGNA